MRIEEKLDYLLSNVLGFIDENLLTCVDYIIKIIKSSVINIVADFVQPLNLREQTISLVEKKNLSLILSLNVFLFSEK